MRKKLLITLVVVAVLGGGSAGAWAVNQSAETKSVTAAAVKAAEAEALAKSKAERAVVEAAKAAADAEVVKAAADAAAAEAAAAEAAAAAAEQAASEAVQFGAGDEGTDDSVSSADNSSWTDYAARAVEEYLAWDSSESPDVRSARLSTYFAAGASELTSIPGPGEGSWATSSGARVLISPFGVPYSGFEAPGEDPNIVNMAVTAEYMAIIKSDIGDLKTSSKITYIVTMGADNPDRILSIVAR
jgi:hypothetical protein